MTEPIHSPRGYSAARFWFSLFSAALFAPSAYWAASIALSDIRPRWFVVFSGCAFFAVVAFVIALFRRAVTEWKKKNV